MSDGAAWVSIRTQMSKLWINESHAYAPLSTTTEIMKKNRHEKQCDNTRVATCSPTDVYHLTLQLHGASQRVSAHCSAHLYWSDPLSRLLRCRFGLSRHIFFLGKNLLKPTQHQTADRRSKRPTGEHGGAFSSYREISLRSWEKLKEKIQQTESEFGLTSLKPPPLGEFSCWHSVNFIHALGKSDKAAHAAAPSY